MAATRFQSSPFKVPRQVGYQTFQLFLPARNQRRARSLRWSSRGVSTMRRCRPTVSSQATWNYMEYERGDIQYPTKFQCQALWLTLCWPSETSEGRFSCSTPRVG